METHDSTVVVYETHKVWRKRRAEDVEAIHSMATFARLHEISHPPFTHMKVYHISAECFPFAKVGGLADVVGSLPHYQEQLGISSQVVMPLYDMPGIDREGMRAVYSSVLSLGDKRMEYTVFTPGKTSEEEKHYFVDVPGLLDKSYVYSADDAERFLAFQLAVLNWFVEEDIRPDIIHCHDHHTGLVPFMVSYCTDYSSLKQVPTCLTIHNAQYQGWMDYSYLPLIPSFDQAHVGLLDWDQRINPLAAAIKCAWRVTTVSNTYMQEMMVKANGLENLLSAERQKCLGILNGIDTEVWNTETDDYLVKQYTSTSIQSGKKANKTWLCKKFGLNPKLPLMVFIGRLVYEKGADLFPEIFSKALGETEMSILLLGSGNKEVEEELEALTTAHKGMFNTFIGYDEPLAHKLYAGADFLFMPSRVEPCGLNQMYAMRYATVPIVSSVGGLKDTVQDISTGGSGICMDAVAVSDAVNAIARAEDFYQKQDTFRKTRLAITTLDFSWDESARQYISLYKSLNSEKS